MAKYTGTVRPTVEQTQARASITDLLSNANTALGVPNPQQAIQEAIQAVPEVPPMREVPARVQEFMTADLPLMETPEDVAAYSNVPFAPQTRVRPVLDEQGNPVVDPNNPEQLLTEEIPMDAYNQQLALERYGFNDTSKAIYEVAQNPYGAQSAVSQLLEDRASKVGFLGDARTKEKWAASASGFKRFVDQVGSPLGIVVNNAYTALMTNETKAASAVDDMGRVVAPGVSILEKLGRVDRETANIVATVGGLALNQTVAQMGVKKKDKTTGESNVTNEAPDGSEFMSDAINSVAHFIKNGIRSSGLPLDGADAQYMAKALITDAWQRGDLQVAVDPDSGNKILVASPEMKRTAMNLELVSDAIAGETKRSASSIAPTATGANFSARKPRMTSKSVSTPQVVTRAADVTKNILGGIAYVFRAKDLKRKQMELDLVFSKEFVESDPETGEFLYSNHPLAQRNGLHRGAYMKAKAEVDVPEGYNKDDPRHVKAFEAIKSYKAKQVMMEEKAKVEFAMKSLQDKTGLRYGEFMHSLANQRFFVNSYDLDYMGSKNVIRDVLGMAAQDPIRVDSLFDPDQIARLKERSRLTFGGTGQGVNEKLTKMSPLELSALGAMHSAVLFYYTALDSSIKNVVKLPINDAIQLYTPAIGSRLADLGVKYNNFLENPQQQPDMEMMGLWVSTEKGEALGTLNLLDDFAKMKAAFDTPEIKRSSMPLTHHVFDDGNQNGIFLQALFFGLEGPSSSSDALTRLSMANPDINDMRRYFMDTVTDNLNKYLEEASDSPEKAEAWKSFWKEAATLHPDKENGVAKDFGKAPLMQNSYGKDASMFGDVMASLLDGDTLYSSLYVKHLSNVYKNPSEASVDLASGVEMTLRQLVGTESASTMKRIGRAFALYNSPMLIEGVTGDTYVITPTGVSIVGTNTPNTSSFTKEVNGKEVIQKIPNVHLHTFINPETGQETQVPSYELQFMPQHAKGQMKQGVGIQRFFNRKEQKHDDFHNPLGMSMARQAVVLTIQSLDGDLVKMTTIAANRERSLPRPVTWVHDSIVSTPGQAMVYRNLYNNVAIPAAIKEMKKMGTKIKKSMDDARNRAINTVKERGEPVGIGAEGEFPVLGAVLDEFYFKVADDTYKDRVFMRMANARSGKGKTSRPSTEITFKGKTTSSMFKNAIDESTKQEVAPEMQWEKFKANINAILDEAEKLGWVEPDSLPFSERKYLAVKPENFPKLMELAERLLRVKGVDSKLDGWLANFEQRVTNAERVLYQATRKGGILQMSAGGGKRPATPEKIGKVIPAAKAAPVKEDDKLVPSKTTKDDVEDSWDNPFPSDNLPASNPVPFKAGVNWRGWDPNGDTPM
jgi:hypothetical protein